MLSEWIVNGHPPMDLADVDIRRMTPFQNSNAAYLRERVSESLGLLYAMHWPYDQNTETARGVRRSPLHERLAASGACFGEAAGWERANWFAPEGVEPRYRYSYKRQNWFPHAAEEHRAVREAVGPVRPDLLRQVPGRRRRRRGGAPTHLRQRRGGAGRARWSTPSGSTSAAASRPT